MWCWCVGDCLAMFLWRVGDVIAIILVMLWRCIGGDVLGDVWVMLWWSMGDTLMICWWCGVPRFVFRLNWWCVGDNLPMRWWWCFHDALVIYRWCFVTLVMRWRCYDAVLSMCWWFLVMFCWCYRDVLPPWWWYVADVFVISLMCSWHCSDSLAIGCCEKAGSSVGDGFLWCAGDVLAICR